MMLVVVENRACFCVCVYGWWRNIGLSWLFPLGVLLLFSLPLLHSSAADLLSTLELLAEPIVHSHYQRETRADGWCL